MAREINLVPDVKEEMIKALKLRNLILFICIAVSIASVVVTLIFGLIMGGQKLARDSKKQAIEDLSSKLNSYNELNQTLTIKNQVENIDTLSGDKRIFTRTFNLLSAIIPTGADTIRISELNINLSEEQPTLTLDAQANAGKDPYIDYNVLDSFKKSMQYMHYDYGEYVDKNDNPIPAYCMIEKGSDGAMLQENGNYFAYWTIEEEGCAPTNGSKKSDYQTENYDGKEVVKIWRTPNYSEWYKPGDNTNITLDGDIKGVPHFNSQCITYTGNDTESRNNPKWDSENSCNLIMTDSESDSGIRITESSNGRDANNELVLRFNATIYVNPEFYRFSNHHMMAIAPSNRVNVTDSFVQIQNMFSQRANDCPAGDTSCQSTVNSGGENNANQSTNGGS